MRKTLLVCAGFLAAASWFEQTGILNTPPRVHHPSCRAVGTMKIVTKMQLEVHEIEWNNVCSICKYTLEAATKRARPAGGAAASARASGSGKAGLLL